MNESNTLGEAKKLLREKWEKGVSCPCCTQYVKLYKRIFPHAAAIGLIAIHRAPTDSEGYAFWPDLQKDLQGTASQGGYGTLSHFWNLIEPRNGEREDGSNRVGLWRITPKGKAFVLGHTTIPKKAYIFNSKCYGFGGGDISIHQALGTKFDYAELMGFKPGVQASLL